MENLANKKCKACELGEGKLNADDVSALLGHIPGWTVIKNHEIIREFKFKNFADALAFVNKVGAIAETEGHHPDISFGWGYVTITLFTHAVDGLSENDFILAAKINEIK
ncbi:MAG: 4a-hydroxytetrahydrobiopterin dehydratase [Patescibacteria group bacterium]